VAADAQVEDLIAVGFWVVAWVAKDALALSEDRMGLAALGVAEEPCS
jgi:hypothetical protein